MLRTKQTVESKSHKHGVIEFVSAEPLLKRDSPRGVADFLDDVPEVVACCAIRWKQQEEFHCAYKVQGGEGEWAAPKF